MREFVYGTAGQFAALDRELSAGKKYRFADRQLPPSCTPDRADIWFSKSDGVYSLLVSRGVSTTAEDPDFRDLLERGEARFLCMDDLASFLRSLQPLFPQTEDEGEKQPGPGAGIPAPQAVDKEKLRAITRDERRPRMVWPEELAEKLKQKVYGQDAVIDALADKVVINRMRKDRKLLAVTLVGPTATGKSETAKSLAEVMSQVYGTPYGYIEIAGSEFIGEHTVHRFFGAPPGYVGHGQATILEPVRKNPNHVIVINEIEKADEKILVGLMEAIDTGMLGMADNSKPIDLNGCILLFTSNIPIDMEKYEAGSEFERAEMCRDAFTRHCGRPEISGKIGNFLVFRPLDDMAVADVIVKFVREELSSFDLQLAHIDEYLMADFLKHRTKYGARGIRGLVSDSVGRHLLRTRRLEEFRNKSVNLRGTIADIEFEVA